MNDSARSIFARIAQGEEAAVKECLDTYGGLVWSLARRFTESVADAEDASQEIFLELWKSASRYDPSLGKESTFIATIARRRLVDRLRSARRRPATEEFVEEVHADPQFTEEGEGAVAVDVGMAQRSLARLSAGQREVLMLGIVEGMTHSEIALKTGKPLGTVKTQMRRGLIKLRESIEGAAKVPEEKA